MFDARRRRLIESREAAKVGRRYFAFYRGYRARRAGLCGNPHKPGTRDHMDWQAGWEFAEPEELGREPSSV